jgi:2-polyprenyl-3-methyl-5-hydroxy-6-metoxy-1,4-benzoquinol methylase
VGTKPGARERLPFVLPDFTRHSWVSELARSTWQPRIARVVRAWLEIEWLSVAAGARQCGLVWIAPDFLPALIPKWESARLSAIQLQIENAHHGGDAASLPASTSGLICILVGALDKIEQLREAWAACDNEVIGTLLGYPPCCRTFFDHVWVEERSIDTTWAMAANTVQNPASDTVTIELPQEVPPLANILWRWLGVRAVPHLPCRFDCSASIAFGKRHLEIGATAGYIEEIEWIAEILAWPVEWSALHGIAEVKSPLMKLSTRTDATARKCVVQWAGTRYPKEGAVGLRFPFQTPKRPMFTKSQAFERGLAHAAQEDAKPSWRYADNGFASEDAMHLLHAPIVALAQRALATENGNVLDLGCGNGILLSKVCQGRGDLIPHGVDSSGSAVAHAKQILGQFAGNFVQGDLFDFELWDSGTRRYALALLMLGRLLEVPRERAMRMLDRLQSSCSRVLAYTYPDWGDQTLQAIARQFGLEVEDSGFGTATYLKEPQVN